MVVDGGFYFYLFYFYVMSLPRCPDPVLLVELP